MTKLDFPDTPSTGQQYGSSGTVWRWDGTRWGSTAGAAGARGAVGYAQITTVLTGLTTVAAVPGLAVTFTADPSRRYSITTQVQCQTDLVTQGITLAIHAPAGTQRARQDTGPHAQANTPQGLTASAVVSGLSGSVTFQTAMGRTYGTTGTVTLVADPTYPAFILVEDITYEAGSSTSGSVEAKQLPRIYKNQFQTSAFTTNGQVLDFASSLQPAQKTGLAQITVQPWIHSGTIQQNYTFVWRSNTVQQVMATGTFEITQGSPPNALGDWLGCTPVTMTHDIVAGQKPSLWVEVFQANPGHTWYFATTFTVVEWPV